MRGLATCSFVAVLVAPAAARADARSEADGHARRGIALYNLGKYEEAIGEFEDAYQLFQSDALLFNLAQAHRKLEHCRRAVDYYHLFLAGNPTPALAAQVETLLPKLEAACRTRDERPEGPVASTPPAQPQVAAATPEPPPEQPEPEVAPAPAVHVTAAAIAGEVISAGNAPVTGVRLAATVPQPWLAHTEVGLAVGAAQLWRATPGDDTALLQIAAAIEYRGPFAYGTWTARGEVGVEYISELDFSSGVVPGTARLGQWAPLVRAEVGAEHDVAHSWAVRAAIALAGCPEVGLLDAAVGEVDAVVGVRYEP